MVEKFMEIDFASLARQFHFLRGYATPGIPPGTQMFGDVGPELFLYFESDLRLSSLPS